MGLAGVVCLRTGVGLGQAGILVTGKERRIEVLLSVSLITKLFRYSIQQEQRMIGSNLAYAANVK